MVKWAPAFHIPDPLYHSPLLKKIKVTNTNIRTSHESCTVFHPDSYYGFVLWLFSNKKSHLYLNAAVRSFLIQSPF